MKAPSHLGSSLAARLPAFRECARAAARTGRAGLDFGFAEFNHALGGARGMGILGGVAGARKTTLLQQLGWQVVQANKDAFFAHFSFEMPPQAIDAYSIAFLAGVEKRVVEHELFESVEYAAQREVFADAVDSCGRLGHTFGIPVAKSVAEVAQRIEEVREKLKIERGFVAIDSIHALASLTGRAARSERGALDNVLNDLRELTDATGVAMLCSAQLTKRGAEREADFHFALSASADYTPDYTATLETERERITGRRASSRSLSASFNLHKNRFGREAVSIPLRYRPDRTCFEEDLSKARTDDDDA